MRGKPETLAWVVIVSAFGVFCLLLGGIGLAAYAYWVTAAEPQWARLTVIEGAVAVKEANRSDPVVGHSDQLLHEGDTVATNASSRAFLTLFDSSTVMLYPDTALTLSTLTTRRYRSKDQLITLSQTRGKSIVGVAPPAVQPNSLLLKLPQGTLALAEGSYTVDLTGKAPQVRVRGLGTAALTVGGETVILHDRQLAEVLDGRPGQPRPLGEELLINSQFRQELSGWQQGVRDLVEDVRGRVEAIQDRDGNRPASRFARLGTRGSWAETYLYQAINKDVSDALSLHLSLDLKLLYQDVQGGGERGSEYPMLVRIDYRTAGGWDAYWVRGFYYTNTANNPVTNGVRVAHNQWVTYVEPQDLLSLDPKPKEIVSIQLIASGHDYESVVGRVSLVAE